MIRTFALSLLLLTSSLAFSQESPSALPAPAEVFDATRFHQLEGQIKLRDAIIADKNAQLATINAILYRTKVESDLPVIQQICDYLIAIIERREKK